MIRSIRHGCMCMWSCERYGMCEMHAHQFSASTAVREALVTTWFRKHLFKAVRCFQNLSRSFWLSFKRWISVLWPWHDSLANAFEKNHWWKMASQGKVAPIRSSKEAERRTENQVLRVQVQERNRRKIPHDCLSANFRNITCVDLAKTDLNGLVFSNTLIFLVWFAAAFSCSRSVFFVLHGKLL